MTKFGLGRTAWAIVALIAALNMYAILPAVSGVGTVAAVALAIPVATFIWVHFLKAILLAWTGGAETGEAGSNADPDA